MLELARWPLLVLGVCVSVPGALAAADKKAEGDMRWGLNYCYKVVKDMDRLAAIEVSAGQISSALERWNDDHAKFLDYMAKAKAKDATVTESTTVYDNKTKQTFAQAYPRCLTVASEIEVYKKKLEQLEASREEKKASAAVQRNAEETKRLAVEAATSAIYNECAGFKGWEGSSGIDERLKAYNEKKKEAVTTLPAVVNEPLTVSLKTSSVDPAAPTTKTIGEWFTFCDKMMPEHVTAIRANEAAAATKDKADSDARRAYNDKVRKEQEAQFKALVSVSSGDRKRILQAKGFLPWWPRGVDLKSAPVWKWEIAITHEPTRCETFQFSGEKMTKTFTELGACP